MLFSTVTALVTATAHVTNPNITDTEFNQWYNQILLPGFMEHQNASLGLRYKVLNSPINTQPQPWEYLALYKTHGNTSLSSDFIVSRDITPDDVKIELTTWNPIQTFESLRQRRGNVPAGRAKFVFVVKLEPREGEQAEKDVEEWYRKQHLDMVSMLKNYRRSTRYRSADGSKPRWLAVHEFDSLDMDPYQGEVLMDTEMAKSVMVGIKTFDTVFWELIFEKGNLSEPL